VGPTSINVSAGLAVTQKSGVIMRLVGIVAVFVLTVTAIVQAAFLVRLSGRVETLTEQVRSQAVAADPLVPGARSGSMAASAPARMPIPRLDPKAPAPAEPVGGEAIPTTAALGQALETEEGRQHLKGALDALKEQERKSRLAENAKDDVEREQQYQERLSRVLQLSGSEQGAIRNLYAQMQTGRERVLEEMRSGIKTAAQADDEIDALEDKTETAVQGLLGEPRMKQLREARRAERMQRRQERQIRQGQAPGAPAPN
jgi:hypothetical protein